MIGSPLSFLGFLVVALPFIAVFTLAEERGGAVAAARYLLTGADATALGYQYYLLAVMELYCLYTLVRSRGREVFVFSHFRFCLAILLTAAVGLAYYRGVVAVLGGRPLWLFLLLVLPALVLMPVSGMLQAAVVYFLDRQGSDPFIKDLVRPKQVGKIGDCNSWVVRRWGQYVLAWFLLIPGLVALAPLPSGVTAALLVLAALSPVWTLITASAWGLEGSSGARGKSGTIQPR